MNNIIVEFQRKSTRTAPFNAKPSNTQEFNWFLSNYTLGLVGEALELSKVIDHHVDFHKLDDLERQQVYDDYIKEMGDVFHYAINLLTSLGEEFKEDRLSYGKSGLKYLAGDFVETIKKKIYHGHDIENEYLIESLYEIINELIDYSESHLELILNTNIEKLKVRYPQCFTVEDSVKRVDLNG